MAVVDKLPGPPTGSAAAHFLQKVIASKPNDGFLPGAWGGMPGGADIPRPTREFTGWAIGPDDWPLVSESAWEAAVTDARRILDAHREGHADAVAIINGVFDHNGPWPAGDGAKQAAAFHDRQNAMHSQLIAALEAIVDTAAPLGRDIRSTKRQMREMDDQMHQDIENHLRTHSGSGKIPLNIGAITAPYRARVQELRTELHGYFGAAVTALGNKVPLAPTPRNADDHREADPDGSKNKPGDDVATDNPHETAPTGKPKPNAAAADNFGGTPTPAPPPPPQTPSEPLTTSRTVGSSFMPSMPTGHGGEASGTGAPSLSGLLGAGMLPTTPLNPTGPGTPTAGAAADRGFASGLIASGASPVIPPTITSPTPPPAATPLTAPPVASATPAAAPVPTSQVPPATPTAATPTAAPASPDTTSPPMASYGSVLPPTAGPSAGASAVSPSAPNVPGAGPGGVSSGAGGLVPVTMREPGYIQRDDTERDIEIARKAVAELAGPSSIESPATDWAVAVAYTCQRRQALWVATNDGSCHLPPGVYLRKSIHLVSIADEDFNSRWLGWWCAAEKAVWAALASGDHVTAVATTQMRWPDRLSETLGNIDLDVAYGVVHGGPNTDASELTSRRIHRLQTLGSNYWRLHRELVTVGKSQSWEFCRELTDRVAYGLDGELSPTALTVAGQLVASHTPSPQQWIDLRSEYDRACIQACAMRPGLNGVERPEQTASYRREFTTARRLETLIRWSAPTWDASDIVYAAIAAGVPVTDEMLMPLAGA